MNNDQYFMKMALDLAATAKGKTNPNPVVGAIIVKEGVIVGSGIHRRAGEAHAEVHAFNMAGEYAKGATLYVTLEPCSHFGKTPPCAILVKDSGVSKVVVAMQDPNPAVAGRGIAMLREAGIEVEVGVLEKEAALLNERFIVNMTKKRPFIISKTAMTLDGKLAAHNGHSQWITGEESRHSVHLLRDEVDAILIGVGTVLADNPSLTARLAGGEQGRNPLRIVLDSELRTPLDAKITECSKAKTWIAARHGADEAKAAKLREKGVDILFVPPSETGLDLSDLMFQLYKKGVTDVLVEGGSEVNGSFLRQQLVDKFIVYMAPKLLGGRHSLTPFHGEDVDSVDMGLNVDFHSIQTYGEDICITAYPKTIE